MIRIVVNESKRALNIGFFVAMLGVVLCICFDSWNDLTMAFVNDDSPACSYYFFVNSAYGGMCRNYVLPILATFPFATSFCEEKHNRAVAFISSREGVKEYGIIKYSVNAVVGGLSVALGTMMTILLLCSRFPLVSGDYNAESVDEIFHCWIAVNNPVFYCFTEICFGFMRGMIWASIAMLVSVYITDRLVITMVPFLGKGIFVSVCQLLRIDNNHRIDMLLIGRTVIKNSKFTVLIASATALTIALALGVVFEMMIMRGHKNGTLYQGK